MHSPAPPSSPWHNTIVLRDRSYAHNRPYPKARDLPKQKRLNHEESLIKGAFLGAYQALADTFRGDIFGANVDSSDNGRAWELVGRYIQSANNRALDSFARLLLPVARRGDREGREQSEKVGRRGLFSKADTAGSSALQLPPSTPRGAGVWPGSIPAWVPPKRTLLRIPPRAIDIPPVAERDFTAAPQVHIDAVASLPLDLVTLIDDSQREGIRAALDEAIRRGDDPARLGMIIANMVGLFPRWQNAVQNLGARMLADGKGQKEVDYRMGRYSDWLRERRGIIIARTEMMTALNTGRMNGWAQQASDGWLDPKLSEKEWLAAPGACPVCTALNGTMVQGIDGVFDTETFGWVKSGPCHPHCRCVVLIHPVLPDSVVSGR